MVITSRGLARLLFLLVLSGFPLVAILSNHLPTEGNALSIAFRALVLVLSIAVFLLSVSRARFTAGYMLLLLFIFFYAVRLVVDIVTLGPQLMMTNSVFFFGVTLAPMIALATHGYDGTDERFYAKWLVYLGIAQCLYFSIIWLNGAGYNSWEEYGVDADRLALLRLNPVSIGHAAVTTVIAASIILMNPRIGRDAKVVCYFAIGLATIAFLSANSRGPAIAGAVAMFWLFSRSFKRSFILFILFAAAILIAEHFTGLLSVMLERFTWDIDTNESNFERVSTQAKAISAFSGSPFFGAFSVDPTSAAGDYPHNLFIEVAMALGVFGLALIVPVVFISWRKISSGFGRSCPLLSALCIQKFMAFQFSGSIAFADAFFVLLCLVLVGKTVRQNMTETLTTPSRKLGVV